MWEKYVSKYVAVSESVITGFGATLHCLLCDCSSVLLRVTGTTLQHKGVSVLQSCENIHRCNKLNETPAA